MYGITPTVCSLKHVEYILDLDAMMIGRQSWCNHKSLLSFFLMAAMLSKLIMVGEYWSNILFFFLYQKKSKINMM